jgi:hypothetical protein
MLGSRAACMERLRKEKARRGFVCMAEGYTEEIRGRIG